MLNVKTPEEVFASIEANFQPLASKETVALTDALGRILYEDIVAKEYVPDFDRSSVDGYAVKAADTFGCSSSLPAIFTLQGEVLMGSEAPALLENSCLYVPTGAAIPANADAMVMIEHSEDYGDGTIGMTKPTAPGNNIVFRGDDVRPGQAVLPRGKKIGAQDIGALAALGFSEVPVGSHIRVGVISTGDELVAVSETPTAGQVRDVNSAVVAAAMAANGARITAYGFIKDDEQLLRKTVKQALDENDMVLISGGSSVGTKDATAKVIASLGELLLHGIAIKPGKPTIMGKADGKPLIGLPGHPSAAYFICHLFIRPLLYRLQGRCAVNYSISAKLLEAISANDGRSQYISVSLQQRADGVYAVPLRAKSSQISSLAITDGYIAIDRNAEGLPKGAIVEVTLYSEQ